MSTESEPILKRKHKPSTVPASGPLRLTPIALGLTTAKIGPLPVTVDVYHQLDPVAALDKPMARLNINDGDGKKLTVGLHNGRVVRSGYDETTHAELPLLILTEGN